MGRAVVTCNSNCDCIDYKILGGDNSGTSEVLNDMDCEN
jgi:hypothetical protein